jgi:hypothetical protein
MPRFLILVLLLAPLSGQSQAPVADHKSGKLGREVAIQKHLEDGDEFGLSAAGLVAYGRRLFAANWTEQDGSGRPLTKGNGKELSDPSRPLTGRARSIGFPRRMRTPVPGATTCPME